MVAFQHALLTVLLKLACVCVGAVRVSFGYMSTFPDVHAVIRSGLSPSLANSCRRYGVMLTMRQELLYVLAVRCWCKAARPFPCCAGFWNSTLWKALRHTSKRMLSLRVLLRQRNSQMAISHTSSSQRLPLLHRTAWLRLPDLEES